MISGINLTETVNYSCKADKKNPTVWKLGAIPSRALAGVTDQSAVDKLIGVARLGIKGWENFKIAGKDVKFEADENGLLDTLLDIIPLNILVELGTQVLTLQKLSDEEIKN